MSAIQQVHGRQIFDSRGRPTVEVEIVLDNGALARASVPSGASTGTHEAHELRDGDDSVFDGLGVTAAVEHVNGEIAAALHGLAIENQRAIDERLRELDGTPSLSRLGANAVLGASLAVCRASAVASGLPLYRRIAQLAGTEEPVLPMPMVNILSGGLHAGRGMDVQDFLAVPVAATSALEAIHLTSRVRTAAARLCADRGLPTLLADEGGLSPACRTAEEALELITLSIEAAGLRPGTDIAIAIDVAASSLFDRDTGDYHLRRQERHVSTADMIDMVSAWVDNYAIVSIEDPLDEDDWAGWETLTTRLGHRIRLIGDDLFTTNSSRLAQGIARGVANGVLVKVNQNGTLTGTLDVVAEARAAGYAPVVSARSGETEDDFLADLAVGTAAGQIKIGSVRNSERLAKYNQLVRIAEDTTLGFSQLPALGSTPVAVR
ncbi:phosphopyruvate hydratase [Paenarthrobacter sp. YIM B13468]|uniref:phosphopyruvate hydratase n=1 Tax=Paenarthrobacter sp. YIM B13468 TaxID=3366295 RepID=UPI00367219DC